MQFRTAVAISSADAPVKIWHREAYHEVVTCLNQAYLCGMEYVYFPIIEENDFGAFRGVMHGELPATYKEWLQRHADRVAHYRKTHKIIEVKAKASDFAAYLHAGGHSADLNRLYIFAESIGKRNLD